MRIFIFVTIVIPLPATASIMHAPLMGLLCYRENITNKQSLSHLNSWTTFFFFFIILTHLANNFNAPFLALIFFGICTNDKNFTIIMVAITFYAECHFNHFNNSTLFAVFCDVLKAILLKFLFFFLKNIAVWSLLD